MGYSVAWEYQYLDMQELARLYWVESWKIRQLAEHFGTSRAAMKDRLFRMKRRPDILKMFGANIALRVKNKERSVS